MPKSPALRRHLPTSPFNAPAVAPVPEFVLGDRVSHDRYGLGRVTGVEEEVALLVDFGSHQARIVTPFKGMQRL